MMFYLFPFLLIVTLVLAIFPWLLFRNTRPRACRPANLRLADSLFMGTFAAYVICFTFLIHNHSSNSAIKTILFTGLVVMGPLALLATVLLALDYRRTAIVLFTICLAAPLQIYIPSLSFLYLLQLRGLINS